MEDVLYFSSFSVCVVFATHETGLFLAFANYFVMEFK